MKDVRVINGAYVTEENDKVLIFNPHLFTSFILAKDGTIENTIEKNKKLLIDKSIIFEDNFNYNLVSKFFENKEKYNFNKLTITDALSYNCNLNCSYCMQQNTFKEIRRINLDEKLDLWLKLINLFNAKQIDLCMFGGEPLLEYEKFDKLFDGLLLNNICISNINAVTNGTICNENIINFINKCKLNSLQITIDGTENIHNLRRVSKNIGEKPFNNIINNIKWFLSSTDVLITINTVLDKANKDDYINLIDYLIKEFKEYIYSCRPRIIFNLGLECHPFKKSDFTIKNILPDSEYQNTYYDCMYKWINKNVAINSILPSPICIKNLPTDLIISPDGSVYNCISGLGLDDFKIGTYYDITNNPEKFIINLINKKKRLDYNCNKCKYSPLCNGGCEYEMISSEKKSSCQKGIFDKHIYDIIKIATMVEEIDNNVFRRRCYESDF